MYPVVFPIYASKIAEKLIINKLLEPFREIHRLDDEKTNKPFELIHNYLGGKARAPSLGQCVYFLKASNKNYNSSDIKLIKDFRQFLRDLPKEDRTIWRDDKFIDKLGILSELRGGGAHINDADPSAVKKVHALLIDNDNNDNPGVLLRAFGCFAN